MSDLNDIVSTYVIYDHPADYPEDYVVRRWIVPPGGGEPVADPEPTLLSGDLQKCRELLQKCGLVNLGRRKEDDLKILEVWI